MGAIHCCVATPCAEVETVQVLSAFQIQQGDKFVLNVPLIPDPCSDVQVADLDADREDDSLAASKLQAQVSSLQALLRARDREVVAAEHALRVLTQQAGAVATSFEQAEHADAQARAAWAASAAATDAGLEDTQQRLVATSQWAEQLHDQGRSASSSLSAEVAQLWNELAAARSENAQLNQDAESAGAARDALSAELVVLQEALAAAQREVVRHRQEAESAGAARQASSAEAAALQEALAAAQQEVVRHRQEAESAGAARQASSAKAAALQEALAAAQQEVAQHRQETESAGAARDALSAEAAALHVALTAAQRESAGQIAELQEALQQQSQESTQIAAGAKREADQLAAERQSLQEQVRVYAQLQILNKLCPLYYYCIV